MNIRAPALVFDLGIVSAYNKHGSFTYAGVCSADVWRPLSIDCQSFPDVQLLRWGSFLGTAKVSGNRREVILLENALSY